MNTKRNPLGILGLILFSHHAAESAGTESAAVERDPLDTPCDDIDISYPLLAASNYHMGVKKAVRKFSKKQTEAGTDGLTADKDGGVLHVQWENLDQQQSTKGEVITARQLVITEYIPLLPTEATAEKKAYTTGDIAKRLTKLKKAVGLPGAITPRDIMSNPSMLDGRPSNVPVKVAVKKETADFPESNEIKGYVLED